MSRATERHHNTDRVEQLSLLSQGELAKLRCPSASWPQEGEVVPCRVPCRDVERHVAEKDSYIQDALPDL
jgi:hypothetical protein